MALPISVEQLAHARQVTRRSVVFVTPGAGHFVPVGINDPCLHLQVVWPP